MSLIETATKIEVTIHTGEIVRGARVTSVNTYRCLPADITLEIDHGRVWEESELRELAHHLLDLADALEVMDDNNESLMGRSTREIVDNINSDFGGEHAV